MYGGPLEGPGALLVGEREGLRPGLYFLSPDGLGLFLSPEEDLFDPSLLREYLQPAPLTQRPFKKSVHIRSDERTFLPVLRLLNFPLGDKVVERFLDELL